MIERQIDMGTCFRGTKAERTALDAYIKLLRAVDSVTGRLAPELAAVDLTWSQFGVLEVLLHLGPLCQSELGRKLLKTGGNITLVIDNLEKRDLVRRERDAQDRRYITVHLTEAGRKLIITQFPRHVARIVAEFSVLSSDEQQELGRLCRKLGLQDKAGSEQMGKGDSRCKV